MSVNRIHLTGQFVQVPNALVRDERLSFKARGILVYMLSHADGWKADYKALAKAGKEGREAVSSGLVELDALGYRVVSRERRSDGRFDTIVHWYDTPGHNQPVPGKP